MPDQMIAAGLGVATDNSPLNFEANTASVLKAYQALPDDAKFRPDGAEAYLQTLYKFGTKRTLAKLRCIGDGPEFLKAGPQVVLYTKAALDKWALSKIGSPVASTSQKAA